MDWKVPRVWEGGQCIIIGGGPSILEQFEIPPKVVKSVYFGKQSPLIYSPYLEPIHNEHVIAVNMAYQMGPWIDMMFFGDSKFWKLQKDGILNFAGLRITCAIEGRKYQRLKYVRKNGSKPSGITEEPTMVSWNLNSGAAAINLAIHTGVKRIILLGFDMNLDKEQNQHWHKVYAGNKRTVQSVFRKQLIGFPAIAADAKRLGVEIINANPNSKINDFPKMNFKDIPCFQKQ